MPDWISHLLIGYIAINLMGIKNRKVVYIGTLLPDVFKIYTPISQIFGIESELILNFFAPPHTVFGVLLTGLFISSFFGEWRRAYALVLLGAFSHLAADSLLYPWGSDMWSLYPLWIGDLGTGIFWSGSPLPLGILLPMSSIFYLRNNNR
ncbi:MAG: hypothetical protein V3R93_05595 [Candidatus Hydrothermarchaeaceae archaeon]